MSFWAALGAGGRAAVMAVGGVAVAGGGYAVWRASQPELPAEPLAVAAVEPGAGAATSAPEVAPEPAPVTEPLAEPAAEAAAAPAPAPELTVDAWRVAPDGSATVAGKAPPDALVRIMVDGETVAETKATAAGEFAALFTLAANPKAALMTLLAVLADGTELPAKAAIALGPIAGPPAPAEAAEDVAAAEPEEPPAEEPAALMLTEDGAAVLQDPDPAPEAEVTAEVAAADPADTVLPVSVQTISYTASGAVQLGGRGEGGAFLRIYLDNQPLQTVLIPDSGQWFSTLKDVPPGVYQLRVDQLDGAGGVTSRFETPFKRESLEALAAAAAAAETPPAGMTPDAPEAARVNDTAPDETAAEDGAEPAAEGAIVVADAEYPGTRPAQEEGPAVVLVEEPAAVADPPAETPAETVAAVEDPALPEIMEPEPAEPEPAAAQPATVETAQPEPAAAEPPAPQPAVAVTVTVQPGHTLWAIAKGQMGEGILYVQVWEANKAAIQDPDLIYPGQVFTIPSGG